VVAYNDDTLRGAVAVQRRHGGEGRAGDLFDWNKTVRRDSSQPPAPASREVRQLAGFQLAELIFG
jgi:hypothetical protein